MVIKTLARPELPAQVCRRIPGLSSLSKIESEPICALVTKTVVGDSLIVKMERLHQPGPANQRPAAPSRSRIPAINSGEQVAAVCFRMKRNGIEFLLVRTGSGRWTFPKGCAEPGLTPAQSAAMEAFEEAGVHGRIEQASFAWYYYRKRRASRRASSREELMVHAHLCEVSNVGKPEESNRRPRWFSIDKAKRRLRERRADYEGAELVRVIDLAVNRAQRLSAKTSGVVEALQKVKFDAFDVAGVPGPLQGAAIGHYIGRQRKMQPSFLSDYAPRLLTGKVLPLKSKKT